MAKDLAAIIERFERQKARSSEGETRIEQGEVGSRARATRSRRKSQSGTRASRQRPVKTYHVCTRCPELALWHLGNDLEEDTRQALGYLAHSVKADAKSNIRRMARILEAEAHQRLGDIARARQVLSSELLRKQHPDLLLGLANLENCCETKIQYINQALRKARLQEVRLRQELGLPHFDQLSTVPPPRIEIGPLISVIIPAYNWS